MPLSISSEAIAEKNKLYSEQPWLILLEITYPQEPSLYLVWNTESVEWGGFTWYPATFDIGEIEETKEGGATTVPFSIVDIDKNIIPILDHYGGAVGAEVIVRIVHSAYLNNPTPEFEAEFEIVSAGIDSQSVINLRLGAEDLTSRRSPTDIYVQMHCRYNEFKGDLCQYDGGEEDCDRTLTRCRELENQVRFGGFPGIGNLGIWL